MARTLALIVACLSFNIVIGGAVYEHLTMVPVWSSAAPASLTMFQGPYAIAAVRFWALIHPVTVILLVAALISNWKTPRRRPVLLTLGGYLAVLIITFLFFVPELLSITQSAYSPTIDPQLTHRAKVWESMSLVRLAFLLVLSISLLLGLSKGEESKIASI